MKHNSTFLLLIAYFAFVLMGLPGLAAIFAKANGAEIIGPFLFIVTLVMVAVHEFIVFRGARAVVAPAAMD